VRAPRSGKRAVPRTADQTGLAQCAAPTNGTAYGQTQRSSIVPEQPARYPQPVDSVWSRGSKSLSDRTFACGPPPDLCTRHRSDGRKGRTWADSHGNRLSTAVGTLERSWTGPHSRPALTITRQGRAPSRRIHKVTPILRRVAVCRDKGFGVSGISVDNSDSRTTGE